MLERVKVFVQITLWTWRYVTAALLHVWTGTQSSRRLRLPEFLDNRHTKVARLSALSIGRLYAPEKIPGTCQRLSRPHSYSAAWKIKSLKNFPDPIGNRTHDLPTCRAVPKPLVSPRIWTWIYWQQNQIRAQNQGQGEYASRALKYICSRPSHALNVTARVDSFAEYLSATFRSVNRAEEHVAVFVVRCSASSDGKWELLGTESWARQNMCGIRFWANFQKALHSKERMRDLSFILYTLVCVALCARRLTVGRSPV